MKKVYVMISSFLLLAGIFFVSCDNSPSSSATKTSQAEDTTSIETPVQPQELGEESIVDSETPTESESEKDNKTFKLTAKFLEFSLGDASHYIFEDEAGKRWDFGQCEAKNYIFEQELEASEINSDNQGWGSNEDLQGKWFEITYHKEEQPLYIDGPMGTVDVISKVTLKK